MKKAVAIPLFCALFALLLCISAALLIFWNGEYSFSKGRCILTNSGDIILVEGNTPTLLSDRTKGANVGKGLSDGDEILILHDGIQESYPQRTGVYFIKKLSDGKPADISEDVLLQLTELGMYSYEDTFDKSTEKPTIKVDFSATDLERGYHHDSPTQYTKLIKSEKELSEYRESLKSEYVIEEPAVDIYKSYDKDFFENSYLVVVYNFAPSGSVVRRVSDVTFNTGDGLNIIIEDYCPVIFTDDCSGWTHIIELSREYEVESIERINVETKELNAFSYSDFLYTAKKGEVGLRFDGFKNTDPTNAETEEKAVELAKKEICSTFTYDTVTTAYDCYEKMWSVCFSTKGLNGGCVTVYLSTDGITKAVLAGE